jgi:hypothetical protein
MRFASPSGPSNLQECLEAAEDHPPTIERHAGHVLSFAHRALHPFGQIPTYEEGDLALFEMARRWRTSPCSQTKRASAMCISATALSR